MFGLGLPLTGFGRGNLADGECVLLAAVLKEEPIDAVADLKGCHEQSPICQSNTIATFLPNSYQCVAMQRILSFFLGKSTGELGFEPRQSAPEALVLPLHHSPKSFRPHNFTLRGSIFPSRNSPDLKFPASTVSGLQAVASNAPGS